MVLLSNLFLFLSKIVPLYFFVNILASLTISLKTLKGSILVGSRIKKLSPLILLSRNFSFSKKPGLEILTTEYLAHLIWLSTWCFSKNPLAFKKILLLDHSNISFLSYKHFRHKFAYNYNICWDIRNNISFF